MCIYIREHIYIYIYKYIYMYTCKKIIYKASLVHLTVEQGWWVGFFDTVVC